MLVVLCIVVTDLFLGGLIYFWGLTLNPMVMLNIVISIGTSVDFSAHIAYSYLTAEVPPSKRHKYNTAMKIRTYKSKMALRNMGSSVFHGGFSTFVAISVLAPAKTYIFVVFYRMWFGIILVGMANGFMLLPVTLSFIGPTRSVLDHSVMHDQEEETYNSNKIAPEDGVVTPISEHDSYEEASPYPTRQISKPRQFEFEP